MGAPQNLYSFGCEILILQAKNLEFKSQGNIFVRYYLSAGNNKRIQLNSQEISSKSNLLWNESLSLECSGTEDSINNLTQQNVVFELRWRKTNPIFGKIGGSQILGRAEIPWKTVLESPNKELEKWVLMETKKSCVLDGVKPPSLKIAMRVAVPAEIKKKKGKTKEWNDQCGCCRDSGCTCKDYEVLALAAAFEAL